jgi:hypothetical protein
MDEAEKLDYGAQNCRRKGQWNKWKGKTCSADGCEKPATCRGYCGSHYNKKKWADGHRPPSSNSRSHRNAHLKHRYGITVAEYDAMLAAQGGRCAVCKQPPGKNVRAHWGGKLCVDHCHETNKVRALLCNDCNLAVGYAKSEGIAIAMVEYFRLHDRIDCEH